MKMNNMLVFSIKKKKRNGLAQVYNFIFLLLLS